MNYKYRIRYDGEQFLGQTLNDIAKHISNSKKIDLEEANKIVSKIAEKLVPVPQSDFNHNPPAKKLSWVNTIAGATAILKSNLGSAVDQLEIEKRAMKCRSGDNGLQCPKLSEISDCRACGWAGRFSKWMNKVKKMFKMGYDIPSDMKDKYCSVCDCSLAAMLPAQKSDFKESESKNNTRPSYCWVKYEN